MYDALIKKVDGSIDYIKIIDNKLVGLNFSESGVKNSNVEDLISLFKSFLYNKDCIFIGYYKDYEIHYDKETQLKHFMKDGLENFELLFQFNGIDAIHYDGPRLEVHKNKKDIIKEYIINGVICVIYLSSALNFINSSFPHLKYDVNTTSYTAHHVSRSSVDEYDKIDYKQALDFIKNSNLDSESKEYLMNEELLQDIFKYYKDTPLEYTANLKFKDLQIISYEEVQEKYKSLKLEEWSAGSYSYLYPNKLFIRNMTIDQSYLHAIAHEFVHLLQAEGLPYRYLVESNAELVASEYFDFQASSYSSSVENLKLLIEIVGPEPIMKLIFSGDDKQLLEIFKNNLSLFDYNKLIDSLCTKSGVFRDNNAEIHSEVRELLCKLYKSINNKDIREDTNIMYDLVYDREKYALSSDCPSTVHSQSYCYLNARKMDQSSFFYLENVDCDKLVNDGYLKEADIYEFYKYNITLEEYYNILANGNTPDFSITDNSMDEEGRIFGHWNNQKNMFELFDKPVSIKEYNTGEYRQNTSSKFISLEEAVKLNYVSISVTDFIPKDKYNTYYEDWNLVGKVYCSTRENIIYDVSSHRVIFDKPGLKDIFKDQYDRMINSTKYDSKVL